MTPSLWVMTQILRYETSQQAIANDGGFYDAT